MLDASALLAYVNNETGGDAVVSFLQGAAICSVNWTEVIQRILQWGMSSERVGEDLVNAGLQIVSFGRADAEAAALLQAPTKHLGLSLGDRACLALAQRLGLPALTAEHRWAELTLSVAVQVIR